MVDKQRAWNSIIFSLKIDKRAIVWEKEFANILDEYSEIVYYTNTK